MRWLQNSASHRRISGFPHQRGVYAVEFAIVVGLFLTMILMVIEISRAMYIWHSLQEGTRRAARMAAVSDFSDTAALERIRQTAVFRDNPGTLPFGSPVTDQDVAIEYLYAQDTGEGKSALVPIPTGSLPACPARNRVNCAADANGESCIRFIRVSICKGGSGNGCARLQYQPLISLINFPVNLPPSASVVKAESLGYAPGMPLCE